MRSLLILILIFTCSAYAEDGKTLYQASCIECHSRMTGGDGTVLYQRDDKIVTSLEELRSRVSYCASAAAAHWSTTDITTVTNYLNENFYHF